MPPRPAPARRPPLAAAQGRIAFDTLLRDRVTALTADDEQTARELNEHARMLADAVDAENATRQQTAGDPPPLLDYDDVVLVAGDAATLVVPVDDYDRERLYHDARAGNLVTVVFGPALLRYLRTGDARRN